MQDHRKLEIWRMACRLAIGVRTVTDRFPKRGYSELKAQMISASESIAHTIVEGCGAETNKEFARFLMMSIKSNRELEGDLAMAFGYRIVKEKHWLALTDYTILIRKKTYTLRKRALNSPDRNSRGTRKRKTVSAKNPKPLTPNRNPQTGEPASEASNPQPKPSAP